MKALRALHDLLKHTCTFCSFCATKDNILKKRELFFMAKRKENLGVFSQFASAQNQNIFSEFFSQTPDCSYAGCRFKSEFSHLNSTPDTLVTHTCDCGNDSRTSFHFHLKIFLSPTRIVSVELPSGARKFGVQFRWWQPYHSGRGHDVWALDEISMTSVLFNTISLDFSNVLDVTQSLGFYLGHVQPYCQHDWTLR